MTPHAPSSPPAPTTGVPSPASSLTRTLAELLTLSAGQGLTLNRMLELLTDRGVALLMVVGTAPFLLPVGIPGLSTPFGAILAFCGIFTALARPVRFPPRLGARQLPHASLVKSVRVLERVFGKFERVLHPRYEYLTVHPTILRVHGVYVLILALVLAIPFPSVPFVGSNAIAAWPIFALGLGLLERDGVFVAIAYLWIAPFIAYWFLFYAALLELWQALLPRLHLLWG